jgi:hypothetical protein
MIERGRRGDAETRARRRKMAARLRETRVNLSTKHGNHFVFSRELGRSFALARKNGVPALIMLTLLIAADGLAGAKVFRSAMVGIASCVPVACLQTTSG